MQGNYAICTGEGLKDKVTEKEKRLEDCSIRATHNPVVLLEGTKKGLCRRGLEMKSLGTFHRSMAIEGALVPKFPNYTLPRDFSPHVVDIVNMESGTPGIWAPVRSKLGHLSTKDTA